jgi:glutaredoxin
VAEVILYGTVACHLCEQAEVIMLQSGFSFTKRDIVDHEDWLERYRVHIPVVTLNEKELFWPFDKQQLANFLEKNQN